jgi:hypothetical protein
MGSLVLFDVTPGTFSSEVFPHREIFLYPKAPGRIFQNGSKHWDCAIRHKPPALFQTTACPPLFAFVAEQIEQMEG